MLEPEDAHEEGSLDTICQDTICQDTICEDASHEATLPGQAQKQAKVTRTSNRSQAAVRVKEDPSGQGSNVLVSVSHPSQDQQTTAGKVMLMGLSLDVHFRRGYLALCRLHSAFFNDRVRLLR